MPKEKFLVTGAGGFIGSSLVRELVSKEEEVYSLIRPETNLWRLPEETSFHHLLRLDLTDYDALKSELKRIRPTHIFHLATYGVYRDQLDQSTILNTNVTGTLNLLKVAQDLDLTAFINTGSVYEYADLPGMRQEAITGTPRNPYDQAKVEATNLAIKFAQDYSLPICTLRLFTTYGPYEDVRRLVPKVILSLIAGESPVISPKPIRDFIHLDDVTDAFFTATSRAPKKGEVINIGSGQPTRVEELVEQLVQIIDPSIRPTTNDNFAPANDSQCWADISLAKKLLDWQPKISLTQGLETTVEWFKNNHHIYS